MTSKLKHSDKYPDFGVPYNVVPYNSNIEKILFYARFKNSPFSYDDHSAFRVKRVRKELWVKAAKKLVKHGWLQVCSDGRYCITTEGRDALIRIGARNQKRPGRRLD